MRSEMTENTGDSWGRTPERGHIHQLYCPPSSAYLLPPIFFSFTLASGQRRSDSSHPNCELTSSREVGEGEKRGRDEQREEMGR